MRNRTKKHSSDRAPCIVHLQVTGFNGESNNVSDFFPCSCLGADDLAIALDLLALADFKPDRGVETQSHATGGDVGRPEHDPHLPGHKETN